VIHVSFSALVCLYLGIMLGPIFGAWLLAEWCRQRREHAAFRAVLRCKLCAGEYADTTSTALPRCPHCGALNERAQLPRF
jgi:hypothetical protein